MQADDKTCEEHHIAIADHNDMPNDVLENSKAKMDGDTEMGSVAELEVGMHHPRDPEENDEVSWSGVRIASEADGESISDEGWQEANSKGRSANTTTDRKFVRRKPDLAKLNIYNEHSNLRESRHWREIISPAKHVPSKTIPSELSPLKHSKAHNLTNGDISVKLRAKASVSKVTSVPATHATTTTSKSLSYKEVALAPPGTVVKPLSDKIVDINVEKPETQMYNVTAETSKDEEMDINVEIPETQMCNVTPETSKDEESKSNSMVEASTNDVTEGTHASATQSENTDPGTEEERSKETNVSKLSAAAEPFNPGPMSMTHPLNSVAVTSVYDVRASQGMLSEPVVSPIAARVPCGPRSPMYYRAKDSFRMRHGFLKFRTSIKERIGSGTPRIMNPNAPEFVPMRAWQMNTVHAGIEVPAESDTSFEISDQAEGEKMDDQKYNSKPINDGFSRKTVSESEKSELATQILLSYIVKSVQHNMDPEGASAVSEKKFDQYSENSSDAIEKDSAIIKIHYGNEGKTDGASDQSSSCEQQDENKKKNGDGEGFTMVTKRRKNRQQLPNGVTGLYNQQPSTICASVR